MTEMVLVNLALLLVRAVLIDRADAETVALDTWLREVAARATRPPVHQIRLAA